MQWLAIAIGVLPLYIILVLIHLLRDQPLSVQNFIFYLAVICPLGIIVALVVLKYLCGEPLRALNLKPGKLSGDLLATLILSIIIIVLNILSTSVLSELLPGSGENTDISNLMADVTGNPRLLILFLGLLIILGAASEEIVRVFLLSRLWKVWTSKSGKLVAVLISASLFGLIHFYQGPVNSIWAGIFGLIMAFYYLRFGRVIPLIIAHYLTNAIQFVAFAFMAG